MGSKSVVRLQVTYLNTIGTLRPPPDIANVFAAELMTWSTISNKKYWPTYTYIPTYKGNNWHPQLLTSRTYCLHGKIPRHEFYDGFYTVEGGPNSDTSKPYFSDGGVNHSFVAILFPQPLGHLKQRTTHWSNCSWATSRAYQIQEAKCQAVRLDVDNTRFSYY